MSQDATTMELDPATVIATAREEAAVLRRNRAAFSPERVEQILDDIQRAAEEWLTFVSEQEAMSISGYKRGYFRQRFPALVRRGHARFNPRNQRERQYLLAVIPREHDITAVRAAARRAAQDATALTRAG